MSYDQTICEAYCPITEDVRTRCMIEGHVPRPRDMVYDRTFDNATTDLQKPCISAASTSPVRTETGPSNVSYTMDTMRHMFMRLQINLLTPFVFA